MSDVEKMAEQCRAWAQQIINDGTSSQAGPDASDMLAMAATLDALGGWNEAIEAAAIAVTSQGFYRDECGEKAAELIRALRRPAAEGEG